MIRPININLNAAHPELPLLEAVTFTGSPSTVLIRGVPPNCGRWAITAVFVAASFPDGSTTTRAAVQSADGVWVATLPATATSGRTANGLRIMADGIDENGEAVTGYILGVADFAVASLDVTPAPQPGETSYQMLYFDEVPSTLRKGDVTKIDGVLKFYNGSAWEPFAALDNAVTRTSANGVKSSGIWSAIWGALSALPTGFASLYDWCVDQLAWKANDNAVVKLTGNQNIGGIKNFTNGVHIQLNRTDSDFKIIDPIGDLGTFTITNSVTTGRWCFYARYEDLSLCIASLPVNSGTLALLQNLAPNFSNSATYAVNDLCVYGGSLYRCTTAVTSAGDWTDSANWTLATVEDVLAALRTALAGKADVSAIPYALGTPIVIDTASSEVVEGETVNFGAATLANRTANIVQVTAATAIDELRITFPAETSGKVRDFGLRVEIGTGSAALAAPALVPIAPTGETIRIENADGTIPALADGTATAKGVTLLYFSENAPGVFVVKGEQVEEVA